MADEIDPTGPERRPAPRAKGAGATEIPLKTPHASTAAPMRRLRRGGRGPPQLSSFIPYLEKSPCRTGAPGRTRGLGA